MTKFYITGTHHEDSLGHAIKERLIFYYDEGTVVEHMIDCDVFINCRHEGFTQVQRLYNAAELGKRIINIGSNSSDGIKKYPHKYAVEKAALEKANEQLFYTGVETTIIKFGYLATSHHERLDEPKIELLDAVNVVMYVIGQPNRIKDITICP